MIKHFYPIKFWILVNHFLHSNQIVSLIGTMICFVPFFFHLVLAAHFEIRLIKIHIEFFYFEG